MILKSLHLRNIRSYVDAKIDFPIGTTLLSGDIGSGKSTILHSIEFALFGLLRGMLSGDALLRGGSREGSVELCFLLDGKEVVVTRTLKRNKESVGQDAGSLLIDGALQPATAIEIKSKILEMLGYPSELLTKSKGLIFRYTVYTPQEEMKEILLGDAEARLGTLRKVFGMDRYKRIQDNSGILVRHLREERKKLEGYLLDWQEKQTQHSALREEHTALTPHVELTLSRSLSARETLAKAQDHARTLHEQHLAYLELKKQHDITEQTIRLLVQQTLSSEQEITHLRNTITTLESTVPVHDPSSIESAKLRSQELLASLAQKRKESLALNTQYATNQAHINASRTIQEQIRTIDNCPTCLQIVGPEHKQTIASEQEHIIIKHQEHLDRIKQTISSHQTDISILETEHAASITLIGELEKVSILYQNLNNAKERLGIILAQHNDAKQQSELLLSNLSKIREQMHGLDNLTQEIKSLHEHIAQLTIEERNASREHQTILVTREQLASRITILESELAKREAANTTSGALLRTTTWLEEHFVPLMGHIESHVLGTIHTEFSEHFCTWFGILIEDPTITTRLDETFTPIITQNGHDTEISFLSGGEKTSCALAYRLALNRVINDVVSTIKTKDLLILDEPTDGFSSEQLDNVRDVLDQLQLEQVLIVSHETKMESFAQSIIRITKEEGESRMRKGGAAPF
ncbi:SMC family ATPase [Candidatus Woesearchaeota archaeon]|nr:SMC family ATPase [Candidatus Woesearchaeota archaeon]